MSPQTAVDHNTMPVILGLTASPLRISPLEVCEISCEAEDADGDELAYEWSATQGAIAGEGANVEWTAPDAEGLFRISVAANDGNGGLADYSTSVRVKRNSAPEFQSMSSVAEAVAPGSSTYISFSVQDPDGDDVAFEWTATGGEVFGEGRAVVWLSPMDPGSYRVACVAADGFGGETTRELPINVISSTAPVLSDFVVKPINHTLLSYDVGVWDIFRGRSCTIECVVLDVNGPYAYEWACDQGALWAEGAVATWEAPDSKGPATISVGVTDANGNVTTGTVLMYVETCTCHFD
jgi:hypothetical protein